MSLRLHRPPPLNGRHLAGSKGERVREAHRHKGKHPDTCEDLHAFKSKEVQCPHVCSLHEGLQRGYVETH